MSPTFFPATEWATEAAARIVSRCDALALISAIPDGIERLDLTPQQARAFSLVADWMGQAGLVTSYDEAGNLRGRSSQTPEGTALLILGSHLDTVPNAGRFDGIVGVLMALEVCAAACGLPGNPPLEVIAFWGEEGTRFGRALLGSAAAAGRWDPSFLEAVDDAGVSLGRALAAYGLSPDRIGQAGYASDGVLGYLEAHIEQGPLLDRADLPLAVVSSIAGARRFAVDILGQARHAGGTPFEDRRDALVGASEAICAIERTCRDRGVIGTVGAIEAKPGTANVIAGKVTFSLDLRAEDDADRDDALAAIVDQIQAICARRHLDYRLTQTHRADAVRMNGPLSAAVRAGIARATGQAPEAVPDLFSKAGHDGMSMAGLTGVGMLFLRNPEGISHHPDELVDVRDIAVGLDAYLAAVCAATTAMARG